MAIYATYGNNYSDSTVGSNYCRPRPSFEKKEKTKTKNSNRPLEKAPNLSGGCFGNFNFTKDSSVVTAPEPLARWLDSPSGTKEIPLPDSPTHQLSLSLSLVPRNDSRQSSPSNESESKGAAPRNSRLSPCRPIAWSLQVCMASNLPFVFDLILLLACTCPFPAPASTLFASDRVYFSDSESRMPCFRHPQSFFFFNDLRGLLREI